MREKLYLRKGDRISAHTLSGVKIIGYYIRNASGFGIIVKGLPEGEVSEAQEFHCSKLSVEKLARPPKSGRSGKGILSRFVIGDPCTGISINGEFIIGQYANAGPKPYAFIRGIIAKDGLVSPFEVPKTYKVLRESLQKQP